MKTFGYLNLIVALCVGITIVLIYGLSGFMSERTMWLVLLIDFMVTVKNQLALQYLKKMRSLK